MRALFSFVAGLALLTVLTFGLPLTAWAQMSPPVVQTEARSVTETGSAASLGIRGSRRS